MSRPLTRLSALLAATISAPTVRSIATRKMAKALDPAAKRVAAFVVFIMAAAGALVMPNVPVLAATIDTNAWYQLINRHSGKALDVYAATGSDGGDVVQWTANANAANQQWQFVPVNGGYYKLRARHSGKLADVSGRSTANGADVIQWSDTGGTNQQWSVIDTSSGYVKLIARHSGKALDVNAASTADGADVIQWTDHGGSNQQWRLVPVGTPNCAAVGTPPGSYPNPGYVTGSTGAHDPAVVKSANGTYIVVTTGANLPMKTSTDRTNWTSAGVVWPGGAPWTATYTGGSDQLWAPDISYRDGLYYLYYSASTFGSQRSAIFLATSPTGAPGSWTHRGLVIESSGSVNYNAIDPNLIVDQQGRWWLTFGSFWTGIKMVRVDPATGLWSTSDPAIRALARRTSAAGAIEAPFVYYRCGYYYQFVSFDLCCRGAQSTYRIMVGRSTSVTGPYVDRNGMAMISGGGTQILAGHGSIHGPGHQAVLRDVDGEVLFYHYYGDNNASYLGINLLGWDTAGWPFVY